MHIVMSNKYIKNVIINKDVLQLGINLEQWKRQSFAAVGSYAVHDR